MISIENFGAVASKHTSAVQMLLSSSAELRAFFGAVASKHSAAVQMVLSSNAELHVLFAGKTPGFLQQKTGKGASM